MLDHICRSIIHLQWYDVSSCTLYNWTVKSFEDVSVSMVEHASWDSGGLSFSSFGAYSFKWSKYCIFVPVATCTPMYSTLQITEILFTVTGPRCFSYNASLTLISICARRLVFPLISSHLWKSWLVPSTSLLLFWMITILFLCSAISVHFPVCQGEYCLLQWDTNLSSGQALIVDLERLSG